MLDSVRRGLDVDDSRWRPSELVAGLLRDVSGLWGAEGATLAVFLVQGLFVARWLGPKNLGVATLVIGYPAFLFTFFDIRATDATIKFLGEFHARDERPQALAVCHFGFLADAASALVTLMVIVLTARWAESHVLHAPHTAALLVAYGIALVARSPAGTSKSILATFGRFRALATAQTVNALFRSALILGLVARGWGVNGIVLGSAVALPADAALTYVLARPLRRMHWGLGTLRASWVALAGHRREVAGFALWADLGGLFGVLAKQTDVLILGLFRGPLVVGYYSLAESVAGFAGNVVAPLQSVVYPRLVRRWGSGDQPGMWRDARSYACWIGLPLAVLSLVALPLVPLGIRLTVGGRYLAAVPATRILIAAGTAWLCLFWVRPLLLTVGSIRWLALLSGVTGVVTVAGMLAAAPRFGAAGVAWAQLAVMVGAQVACFGHLARIRRATAATEPA